MTWQYRIVDVAKNNILFGPLAMSAYNGRDQIDIIKRLRTKLTYDVKDLIL